MLPSLPFFFSRKRERERENKEKERKWKQDQQSWTTLKAVQNHFIPLGRKKWRRASNMTAPGLLLLPLLLLLVQFASAVERNTWLSPRDSPRWVRRNTASFGSGPIWFLDCRAKLNDSPQKRGQRCSLPRLQACYLLRERKKKKTCSWGLGRGGTKCDEPPTRVRDGQLSNQRQREMKSKRQWKKRARGTVTSLRIGPFDHLAANTVQQRQGQRRCQLISRMKPVWWPSHTGRDAWNVFGSERKKKKTKRERERKKLFTHTVYAARPSVIWAGSATAGVHTPRTHARQ